MIWTPHSTRDRKRAEVDDLARSSELCTRFTRELREIDPLLEMRQVRERVNHPRLKPGQYIIVRHNEAAPPSIILVKDQDGNPIEPDSRVFDELLKADLWRDDGLRNLQKRREAADRARKREEEREGEERVGRLAERARHHTVSSIAV